MWTVTRDTRRKNLFAWARFSTDNNLFDNALFITTQCTEADDNVIITDFGKYTITVLDANSGNVFKVCDVKGKAPCGVTLDDNGNIYVCYGSGEISVWSGDMTEERCLVAGSERLEDPFAML